LRSARYRAFLLFLVLHQIGSSHCQMAPAETFPKSVMGPGYLPRNPGIAPRGAG